MAKWAPHSATWRSANYHSQPGSRTAKLFALSTVCRQSRLATELLIGCITERGEGTACALTNRPASGNGRTLERGDSTCAALRRARRCRSGGSQFYGEVISSRSNRNVHLRLAIFLSKTLEIRYNRSFQEADGVNLVEKGLSNSCFVRRNICLVPARNGGCCCRWY
jgi:hypothetical protein